MKNWFEQLKEIFDEYDELPYEYIALEESIAEGLYF